jgi:hypothetical protein
MALKTLGTNANNSLEAVQFNPSADVMTDSDLALFNVAIQPNYGGTDPNNGKLGTYISRDGQLWIPQRGWLRLKPGDWLVTDSTTGFPFILSKNAVASGPYTHS